MFSLGNLKSLYKQARAMQGRIDTVNDELRLLKVTGAAGGGLVSAEMNGMQEMVGCAIDPVLFQQGDREMIEDLVRIAVNQALVKSRELQSSAVKELAASIDVSELSAELDNFPNQARR